MDLRLTEHVRNTFPYFISKKKKKKKKKEKFRYLELFLKKKKKKKKKHFQVDHSLLRHCNVIQ